MTKEKKTLALLLKKTLMANDDAALEFFTSEFGRVSIFVKKLAKSKTKNPEIDFFRLLELVIFEGRNSKSLKEVSTVSFFQPFEQSYRATEKGFAWLEKCSKVLPEEKPLPAFFAETIKFMEGINPEFLDKYDAFFRMKVLDFSGVVPRFDQIQGDVFFDPQHSTFYRTPKHSRRKITNLSRQILEFLRRSDFADFQAKKDKLPDENFEEVLGIIAEIERWHE